MTSLFGIGFSAPWLLVAALALPILWLILRSLPPAPLRRVFPGVILLLGIRDEDARRETSPWWLMALRMIALGAIILGLAGPVLNPPEKRPTTAPLLVLMDASWASNSDWDARVAEVQGALEGAALSGRPVAFWPLTALPGGDGPPAFAVPRDALDRLATLRPNAWPPDLAGAAGRLALLDGPVESLWISDGLDHPGRDTVLKALQQLGPVHVMQADRPIYALRPLRFEGGEIVADVLRIPQPSAGAIEVLVQGPDPAGQTRILGRATTEFSPGKGLAKARLSLPPELRNRITRAYLDAPPSAGAVALSDDALKRPKVALFTSSADREALQLLAPGHYLRQALGPYADLIDGSLETMLLANPDVLILADVAVIPDDEAARIGEWVRRGGILLRFAGPRLAGAGGAGAEPDPLLPVQLRRGGRDLGGTMSWEAPRHIAAFERSSPFFGLTVPAEVTIGSQVLAEPSPELAKRTIARLTDGTPLVTRRTEGLGQIVLFHVTANAEWSNLPLSGLFVDMLQRLAVAAQPDSTDASSLEGTNWQLTDQLLADGQLVQAPRGPALPGQTLAHGPVSAGLPPGLYQSASRTRARNVLGRDDVLAAARWPATVTVLPLSADQPQPLGGWLLMFGLALFAADIVAALALSGRLMGTMSGTAARTAILLGALSIALSGPDRSVAQDSVSDRALTASAEVVLAHVLTGDAQTDAIAEAGLTGLSDALFARTSVEPANPVGVDPDSDELALYPMLYWPMTPDQPIPTDRAYARLNAYLRNGGLILFDTRDADLTGAGQSASAKRLQTIALRLDLPPLEPVPADHVLTRSFYLLQAFPGRYANGRVWAEAAFQNTERAEGMPFRNLNDNVTPVVIGGNDWSAAWAVDEDGNWMFPIGRGQAGERQREFALRFGINLVMHVLTGNYKSDQVHVPALLERLGQ